MPLPAMTGVAMSMTPSSAAPPPSVATSTSPVGGSGTLRSTVTSSGSDVSEMVPAGLVCLAVKPCGPSARLPVVIDQVPSGPTTAVPSGAGLPKLPPGRARSSNSETVSPGVPEPLTVRLSLLVRPSPSKPELLSGAKARSAGLAGTLELITSASGVELADGVPAVLVWRAVRLRGPSARAWLVIDQVPSSPTVALPTGVSPSNRVTRSPVTPRPVTVGVVSLVMSSPARPELLGAAKVSSVGASGVLVSIVMPSGADAEETVPPSLIWVAVRWCTPSARLLLVIDQVWSATTVAVPMTVSPSDKVMVSPAAPRPVMVGVATLVRRSPAAPLSLAAASARLVGPAPRAPRTSSRLLVMAV